MGAEDHADKTTETQPEKPKSPQERFKDLLEQVDPNKMNTEQKKIIEEKREVVLDKVKDGVADPADVTAVMEEIEEPLKTEQFQRSLEEFMRSEAVIKLAKEVAAPQEAPVQQSAPEATAKSTEKLGFDTAIATASGSPQEFQKAIGLDLDSLKNVLSPEQIKKITEDAAKLQTPNERKAFAEKLNTTYAKEITAAAVQSVDKSKKTSEKLDEALDKLPFDKNTIVEFLEEIVEWARKEMPMLVAFIDPINRSQKEKTVVSNLQQIFPEKVIDLKPEEIRQILHCWEVENEKLTNGNPKKPRVKLIDFMRERLNGKAKPDGDLKITMAELGGVFEPAKEPTPEHQSAEQRVAEKNDEKNKIIEASKNLPLEELLQIAKAGGVEKQIERLSESLQKISPETDKSFIESITKGLVEKLYIEDIWNRIAVKLKIDPKYINQGKSIQKEIWLQDTKTDRTIMLEHLGDGTWTIHSVDPNNDAEKNAVIRNISKEEFDKTWESFIKDKVDGFPYSPTTAEPSKAPSPAEQPAPAPVPEPPKPETPAPPPTEPTSVPEKERGEMPPGVKAT